MTTLRSLSAASITFIAGAAFLTGCSGAPEAAPATVTVTATATVTAEPESAPTAEAVTDTETEEASAAGSEAVPVGKPADHAGVRLTVTKATASDTVTRNVTNSRQGSGYDE